jgi:uncharacterized membrane protein required for colicin V production
MSLADIFVLGVLIFFAFFGFRRGALRTLYSNLRIYFSFIVTMLFYERLAPPLQAVINLPSGIILMICFGIIFVVCIVVVWLISVFVKKRVAKPSQTTSGLSKIGGWILGLLEGVLIISIVIMAISFYHKPEDDKPLLEDTLSYRVLKFVAPSMETFGTGPIARLKELSERRKAKEAEDAEEFDEMLEPDSP